MKNIYQNMYEINIKDAKGKYNSFKFVGKIHYGVMRNNDLRTLIDWDDLIKLCNKDFPSEDIFEDIYYIRAYPNYMEIRDNYRIYRIKKDKFASLIYKVKSMPLDNSYSFNYLMSNLKSEEFIEYVKDVYEKLNKKKYLREDK